VTGAGTVAEVLRAVDLLGVAANALLGGAVARRHNLDPIGFAVLAILSGLGGGLLRDVLLQKGPPVALTDYSYLVTALVAAGVAFAVRFEGRTWDRVFPVVDALALGAWSAVGAQKTLLSGRRSCSARSRPSVVARSGTSRSPACRRSSAGTRSTRRGRWWDPR
jgi:uncharacterized membrane protein YeiH